MVLLKPPHTSLRVPLPRMGEWRPSGIGRFFYEWRETHSAPWTAPPWSPFLNTPLHPNRTPSLRERPSYARQGLHQGPGRRGKDFRHIRQGNHLLTLMKRLSMWSRVAAVNTCRTATTRTRGGGLQDLFAEAINLIVKAVL